MSVSVPPAETQVAFLRNVQRLLAEGTAAVEQLPDRLADTPTPAGPTRRELRATFIPLDARDNRARRA